ELDRAASASGVPPEIADDARLIRSQVERCREILDQMSGRADTSSVHAPRQLAPGDLVTAMLDTFSTADRERVQVDVDADGAALVLPVESAARTLRTLVKNAFDASPPGSNVRVSVRQDDGFVHFAVEDTGTGMDAETLQRAGEPFFTTKPPGSSFGLGLFLARTFAERWGGTLSLTSAPGTGTSATLLLPVRYEDTDDERRTNTPAAR